MISKAVPVYDDAMRAVWQDVRVAALLAAVAFLLAILTARRRLLNRGGCVMRAVVAVLLLVASTSALAILYCPGGTEERCTRDSRTGKEYCACVKREGLPGF